MAKVTRRYSAQPTVQVVLEVLKREKTPGQIAKPYRGHPNSVGIWKRWCLERGLALSERADEDRESGRRVAELEQLRGKEEVRSHC